MKFLERVAYIYIIIAFTSVVIQFIYLLFTK